MDIKDIYNILSESALRSVVDVSGWVKVNLYIERQVKSVGFKSTYVNSDQEEVKVDTEADYFTSKAVKELYNYTRELPQFEDWNRAVCSVSSNDQLSIEYVWDQEWQDEIDSYDNRLT